MADRSDAGSTAQVASLEAENARLRKLEALTKEGRHAFNDQNEAGKTIVDFLNCWLDQEKARAETAERQLAEAREALEPFAKFAAAHDGIDGIKPDLGENYVWLCPSPGYPQITTADFRRARAALAAAEKPGSDGEK